MGSSKSKISSTRRSSNVHSKIRKWSPWELWEADEVRLDCVTDSQWRNGNGEHVQGMWDDVEDTKAQAGSGQLVCTNLRIIWISFQNKKINVSIGLNTVTDIHTGPVADSDTDGTVVLYCKDPWCPTFFEFRFTSSTFEQIVFTIMTAKRHLAHYWSLMVSSFDLRNYLSVFPASHPTEVQSESTDQSRAEYRRASFSTMSSLSLPTQTSSMGAILDSSDDPPLMALPMLTLRAKPCPPNKERIGESSHLPPSTPFVDSCRELFLQEQVFGTYSPVLLLSHLREPFMGSITITNLRVIWQSFQSDAVASLPLMKITELNLVPVPASTLGPTSDDEAAGHRIDIELVERAPAIFTIDSPINPNDEILTLAISFFIQQEETRGSEGSEFNQSLGSSCFQQISSLVSSSRMPYSVVPISPRNTAHDQAIEEDWSTACTILDGPELEFSETEQNKPMCVVCMEKPLRVAFSPCGHFSCCGICARSLKNCPICRRQVRAKLRIYQCGVDKQMFA
eukprot:GHVP01018670.1.p1 GENE.GHVP01018670.1~~GHVP01018670.1.p1  ORF type:complete len:509 (-),score=62.92 GHVP01018670.1:884-2410(-)